MRISRTTQLYRFLIAKVYPFILAVAPVENLSRTMKRLYLSEFRQYATLVGLDLLLEMNDTYTVFAPENRAFHNTSETTLYV